MKGLYLDFVKHHFLDWKENGFCSSALELNKNIGEDYFSIANPHFFTGDLDAEIILVHLNPKIKANQKVRISDIPLMRLPEEYQSFNEYLIYYSSFGKKKYGVEAKRNHKSPFDHKQVRFLKPFDLLPINSRDKFKNLENVIDKKLQIELIPFGSEDFNFVKVGIDNLDYFFKPILKLITSKERKYIIFCGKVFESLLSKYITKKNKIFFKLPKKDGSLTVNDFEIINVKISIDDMTVVCAIAPQFAKQGYPVGEYGRIIKELYGKFNS